MSKRFQFGENWQSFLSSVEDNQIQESMGNLQSIFDTESLAGKTFLDVGCGSGIFSLAAHRLGADQVVSFDYDDKAVACCEHLREREGADNWEVSQGSILDSEFVESLGIHDCVYCWGVVHHTGSMWEAIDNVSVPVGPAGRLCLGIYNEVTPEESFYNSYRARHMKEIYHEAPDVVQSMMVAWFGIAHLSARTLLKRESPLTYLEEYSSENRGMDYWHDVRDWLGGLPFEFAKPAEVEGYLEKIHGDFDHVKTNVRGSRPGSVNTYIFDRSD